MFPLAPLRMIHSGGPAWLARRAPQQQRALFGEKAVGSEPGHNTGPLTGPPGVLLRKPPLLGLLVTAVEQGDPGREEKCS